VESLSLLIGTLVLRPYVFAFLAAFLLIAVSEVGARRAALWTVLGFGIAFACEWSSTRNGFPFGLYHYLDAATRHRELWLSNVPFMDSLSFAFLSYVSWSTARRLLGVGAREEATGAVRWRPGVWLLAAALMVAIDVVCDPLTLQGDRWFLGRIYYYEHPGAFFGVPLTNFAGWAFVALAIVGAMMGLEALGWSGGRPRRWLPASPLWAPALYGSIVLFNVAVAVYLDMLAVAVLGLALVAGLGAALAVRLGAVRPEPGLEEAG